MSAPAIPRKARYQGHNPYNDLVREDWIKAIRLSPDHFEAHLYRPVTPQDDAVDDGYEQKNVIELDTHQNVLSYADPELVAVLDCPDEQMNFFTMADNESNLGESIDPLMLRIAAHGVPIGSVLEWDEETATGIRTVWWYVHKAIGYGTANVGVIYICIPMRDFSVPLPPPAPELPTPEVDYVAPENNDDGALTKLDQQQQNDYDSSVIEL